MWNPNSAEGRDQAYQLHSNTNARKHLEVGPLVIEKGEGVYVVDIHGKKYIEGMAGLWSVGVGFNEPRLVKVAAEQMAKLPYMHTFAHRSHGPAIDLAEKLIKMVPFPMSKVMFTNSGSEANDTAIKLIWYRSNALGKPDKKKIISRMKGYHGITIAAGSLTGLANNHRSFDIPLPGFLHTTAPHQYREGKPGESEEEFATRLAQDLEDLILKEGPETIAAFFGEPVMGAGGVIVPPATYWDKVQAVLKKYDILLVADEVICGFGRVGTMFACETFNIKPDILVLSKQLSSSYLPISALVINDNVFEPIADESNRIGILGHGYTGAGHPVAAAVAVENLKIIEERDLVGNARASGARMLQRLRDLQNHPLVGEVRGIGLIAAVELVTDKAAKKALDPVGKLGGTVSALLQQKGSLHRNMGDAIAFCPPLIITEKQVDEMVDMFASALDEAKAHI